MAVTYKNLGQSNPAATTETTLYTVPAATSTIISTLVVCNQAASAGTFRVAVNVGGGATAAKDYLYYDVTIPANDTFCATLGITLATTDKVKVFCSSATMSFSIWGSELT